MVQLRSGPVEGRADFGVGIEVRRSRFAHALDGQGARLLAALACFGATAIVALCLRRYVDVEWTKSPEARVATVPPSKRRSKTQG